MPNFLQFLSFTGFLTSFRSLLFTAVFMLGVGVSHADQVLPLDPSDSSFHFTGESFLHNFHGEAKVITGSANVNLSVNPPVQNARLDFKTAELTTFNGERNDKMKQWMKIDVHSDIEFTLEKVTLISGDCRAATLLHPAQFEVTGTLTLNAEKQRITGQARGWRDKDRLIVTGDISVNTLNYGLPQIRLLVITVAPVVNTSYRFSFKLPRELAIK